jgi:hypothetical protein
MQLQLEGSFETQYYVRIKCCLGRHIQYTTDDLGFGSHSFAILHILGFSNMEIGTAARTQLSQVTPTFKKKLAGIDLG